MKIKEKKNFEIKMGKNKIFVVLVIFDLKRIEIFILNFMMIFGLE